MSKEELLPQVKALIDDYNKAQKTEEFEEFQEVYGDMDETLETAISLLEQCLDELNKPKPPKKKGKT